MTKQGPKPPHVYTAIARVMAGLSKTGLKKSGVNSSEGYRFRSLDELFNALSPLLVQHRLCVLPRILERAEDIRRCPDGPVILRVSLQASFDLVAVADGSMHTIVAFGEAIDQADKATAKAMASAFKYAMVQAFCIPLEGSIDSDADDRRINGRNDYATPVQGWVQWTRDILDLIAGCMSADAVNRVQQTYRQELRTIAADQNQLFIEIGKAIKTQKQHLASSHLNTESAPGAPRIPPINIAAFSSSNEDPYNVA